MLKIALDVLPYRINSGNDAKYGITNRFCDYSGLLVHSKTNLPLFRVKSLQLEPFATSSFEIQDNKITINLRNDIYWNTGQRVVAGDYVRAIKFICRDHLNIHRILFDDIYNYHLFASKESNSIGVYALNEQTILFELKYKNPFFIYYLSNLAISPLHEYDDNAFAGPYGIKSYDNLRYVLSRNKFFNFNEYNKYYDEIEFLLARDGLDIDLFKCNKVHITSDTSLKFDEYSNARENRNFYENISDNYTLIMLLSAGSKYIEMSDDIKSIIFNVINRQEICTKLNNIPIPVYSFMDTHNQPNLNKVSKLLNKTRISVSYENFYPNEDVVKLIAEQLEPYNIELDLYIDEYMEKKAETHLRLEIRTSMLHVPLLFYKADLYRGLLTSSKYNLAIMAYSYIVQNPETYRTKIALLMLDKIFTKELISLPLLVLPKSQFVVDKVIQETIFAPGEPICYE